MVHIGKVYTKTGDSGSTSLVDGTRVGKDEARIAAYGDVDELNATLGVVRELLDDEQLVAWVAAIQNDLFDLGADLATPMLDGEGAGTTGDGDEAVPAFAALRVVAGQVERLESQIDAVNENLPDLTSFVLPGGCLSAAELHRARTICRRAERITVGLARNAEVNPDALRYLNRLSDWLFVMSRKECVAQGDEIHWVPAANR